VRVNGKPNCLLSWPVLPLGGRSNMKNYKDIDEYIKDALTENKEKLVLLRNILKKMLPKAEEAIRYGMPTFRLNNKNLLHFAAYKKHIGFYPTPGPIKFFKKELAGYETSKGAIQFPLNKPLPMALIKKIIKFRIKEIPVKER
jgi:uncharacterized protein YdhG (YjbR/CyaY superfamily)